MQRRPQDSISDDFGSILGTHLGTSLGSFWTSCFDVFLIWFLGCVFVDLGSIWSLFWDSFLDLVASVFCNSM